MVYFLGGGLIKKANEEKLTLKAVALEWHKKASVNKAPDCAEELMQGLENHIFGFIGNKKIIDLVIYSCTYLHLLNVYCIYY